MADFLRQQEQFRGCTKLLVVSRGGEVVIKGGDCDCDCDDRGGDEDDDRVERHRPLELAESAATKDLP